MMIFKVSLLSCLMILGFETAAAAASAAYEIQPYIVNGRDAKVEEFPFVVSLQSILNETHSMHSCAGSILNENWILTSALCIAFDNPETFLIEYATTEISDGSNGAKIAFVENLIWHERFSYPSFNDDIGLVKVKAPLAIKLFNFKVKLPVEKEYFETGTSAVLVGWGRVETNGPISSVLQKVDLQVYSSYDCSEIHGPGEIFYNNICAGVPEGGKGQCSGDGGGPLLVRGVQVGITSWSQKPCAIAPYPGVFTSVAAYIDWIEEKSGLKFKLNMFLQSK